MRVLTIPMEKPGSEYPTAINLSQLRHSSPFHTLLLESGTIPGTSREGSGSGERKEGRERRIEGEGERDLFVPQFPHWHNEKSNPWLPGL